MLRGEVLTDDDVASAHGARLREQRQRVLGGVVQHEREDHDIKGVGREGQGLAVVRQPCAPMAARAVLLRRGEVKGDVLPPLLCRLRSKVVAANVEDAHAPRATHAEHRLLQQPRRIYEPVGLGGEVLCRRLGT